MGNNAQMITGRALEWLRNAVLAMFVLALLGGLFLPVYTDEIGWRFQTRAGFDGVDKMFSELCGPNTLAVPAFFMWPVRWFSAAMGAMFADPLWVRVSGVLHALGFGWLLWRLTGRVAPDRQTREAMIIVGFGLLCLGVQPFIAVLSRPEQPLLLTALGALLLALPASSGESTVRSAWLRSFMLLALAIMAMSYHLKGLFLLPVFAAALLLASSGKGARVSKAVVGVLLATVTAVALAYWTARFDCPDDPVLQSEFARNNIGATLAGKIGLAQIPGLLTDLSGQLNPMHYITLQAPREVPLSGWLPSGQISATAAAGWHAAVKIVWTVALVAGAGMLAISAWRCWEQRRLASRLLLCGALLATLAGWSMTQLIRNFYEAGFVLPLLATALVLAMAEARLPRQVAGIMTPLAAVIGLAALVSPPMIARAFAPSLIEAAHATGYLPKQPNSVPVFGYSRARQDIVSVARQCGIDDPAQEQALLLDDTTYFAMLRGRLPQHRLGVLGGWRGTINDPVAYLKSRGSRGMVLGCHWLPPDLRAKSRQHGAFCCLGPPGW